MTDVLSRLASSLADRYRIERELGQGGMATVYLAHDVRHDRKVALKILRPELAAILGAQRFLAEIKTTANLQHPHILSLFDSGEADGTVFYVMPFVEGESLRDRINREKQLPVDDALRIAREVLDALDYAHRHGVIHRDIKPENVLLHDGRAQVADFGIALAVSRSDGGTRMTETGMSLGTPHYMSPEQAMGEREITPKADLYALGCVLYEMLTGEPPFTGPTAQAIIARVMTEHPRSLTLQRRTIPPHIEAVVGKALEKLPADRFASAAAFAEALGKTDFAPATTRAGAAAQPADRRAQLRRGAPWAVLLLVAAAGAWGTFRPRPLPPPPPVARFPISYESDGRLSDGTGSPIAISPDGSRLVYVGVDSARNRWLYLRSLERTDPIQIAGTAGAIQPFFSPDGASVGFEQGGRLRKVSLAGGAVVTIDDGSIAGASWGPGDVIVFSRSNALWQVSAAGGEPAVVARPDTSGREVFRWPDLLPDGRTVLFTLVRQGVPELAAVVLGDSTVYPIGQAGMYPRYVTGGYVVFLQQDGTLFAAPFDVPGRRLAGPPVPIADGVRFGPAFPGKLGIARTGTLAYLGGQAALREIVIVERATGRQTTLAAPNAFYSNPRFSADGGRIALSMLDFAARQGTDVWVYDLRAGNLSRMTFDSASGNQEWAPDGRSIVYASSRPGVQSLFRIATDGSGSPESLLARAGLGITEAQLSRDGRHLVFRERVRETGRDVWVVRLDSAGSVRPLLRTPFQERGIALSPDGVWLAYVSDETGTDEVFVRRLEAGSGRWKVSTNGGREPRWGPLGRELFYRRADEILVTIMAPGREPQFSPARPVLNGSFNATPDGAGWDVSPDGRRFVFTRTGGQSDSPALNVVLHWFDQQRAAAR